MYLSFFRLFSVFVAFQLHSVLCAITADSKSLSSNSAIKSDVVEGSGTAPGTNVSVSSSDTDWRASGASPDDEDGDVTEGSAAEVEGSARPPPVVPIYGDTSSTRTTSTSTLATTGRHLVEEDVHIGHGEPETPAATHPTTTQTSTTRMPSTVRTRPPTQSTDDDAIVMLKPGILAAVSGGAVVGILMTILLVMFVVYRIRQRDEGSYALDEPHPHYTYSYQKANTKEFYA
jgi:hypothetical protein